MVDAQIDEVQQNLFNNDFDLLDVPRDRFLVAGDAWAMPRAVAPIHRSSALWTWAVCGSSLATWSATWRP